jgi:hypothetical protein
LFCSLAVKGSGSPYQDRTNVLLRKSCEGRFEIAIGSGINKNEFQTERTCRRL